MRLLYTTWALSYVPSPAICVRIPTVSNQQFPAAQQRLFGRQTYSTLLSALAVVLNALSMCLLDFTVEHVAEHREV